MPEKFAFPRILVAFPVSTSPSPSATTDGIPDLAARGHRRAPPAWTGLERVTLLAIVLLFAARDLPWRLSDYDQAKQAFTSLEMVRGGQWAFQHLPGTERPATKPPLIGWLAAGLRVFPCLGNWELAWRLPSALAAAGLSILLWRAGREVWPAGGAALAVGAFGLNALAPRLAMLVRTDMPLTLWITALGLLIWRRARSTDPGPWTARERWAVFALVTAAMLTKGPVVYAFLAPGLLAHALWERRRLPISPSPRLPVSRPPLWPWLAPLAVFGVWLAVGCWTQPGFYENVVAREFLGRFDGSANAVHRPQPAWFYALHLLARWAPWSVLLLGSAFFARRAWRAALDADPGARWLLCWAVGGLLFMSAVPSKRVDRIFPVIPPLSLLLVTVAGRVATDPRRDEEAMDQAPSRSPLTRAAVRWALPLALATAVANTGYEVGKSFHRHEHALDRFGREVRALTAARGWSPAGLAVDNNPTENDEAVLVALRSLRWLPPDEALPAWQAGSVDTLVLDAHLLEEMRGQLGAFTTEAPVVTVQRESRSTRYVFIRRAGAVAALTP